MFDRAILLLLLVEYSALLAYYICVGQGTKVLYWLGATLLQLAVMRGLK